MDAQRYEPIQFRDTEQPIPHAKERKFEIIEGSAESINGYKILGQWDNRFEEILTPEAIQFVVRLSKQFESRRQDLLKSRQEVQEQIDRRVFPDFLPETEDLRKSEWKVAPIPIELLDRRVEITGPVDRKMVINALNSSANVFMADFEDSHSPTWKGTIEGQINLFDAVRRQIQFTNAEGKEYRLNENTAVLFVRPRGWHLSEKHFLVDDLPISASLFDFGLFFFHNAAELVRQGKRPCFYLPKMEHYLEARLWNDVFVSAQSALGLPVGTIRATALVETILAAFQMDEILYELRDHSAGLNCGRWDYIFSFIKKFRAHRDFVLPDRAKISMDVHFLKSYCQKLIQVCHRRGIHAMGGMAAQIPIKNDPAAHSAAIDKVIRDKTREVNLGHDGTWVAHPGLVPVAREVFNAHLMGPNQIASPRAELPLNAIDLLAVPQGPITEEGIRNNIRVSLLYLESWLNGLGCVPLFHLMEDAATAEIARAQLWQWVHHGKLTTSRFNTLLSEEMRNLLTMLGEDRFSQGNYDLASQLLANIVLTDRFEEFLTLAAYAYLD